jgi:hypothetical protein
MRPELQSYELGKIATKLQLAKESNKKPGAPPPITPVGMTGGGATPVDGSKLTDAEWFARRKAQKIQKLKQTGG